MKKKLLYLVTLFCVGCVQEKDYTQYVNPNIGTEHCRWFFFTPASQPFGMAKLAPSTDGSYGSLSGWEANGYDDRHTSIEGFTCIHEFQLGGITLMPTVGDLQTTPGRLEDSSSGYRSNFDKKDESTTAGYYRVLLKDYSIQAELTALKRVGFQRYTFPESNDAHILFDIGSRIGESGPVIDSYINVIDGQTLEGYVVTKPMYVTAYQPDNDSVPIYFFAKIDKEATSWNLFYRDSTVTFGNTIQGKGACVSMNYQTTANEQITVTIGLSYTSMENAQLNYQSESTSFEEAKETTRKTWNEMLGRIDVSSSSEANKEKFYTALYHVLLGRGIANDVNGAYPKNDGSIGQIPLNSDNLPLHNHYNTDAVWGVYWNLSPLWALAYPEYYSDFINSQLLIYKDTGWLADGIAASRFVSGVGTNMVPVIIAGAYQSGIRNFDLELAYKASLKNEVEWINRPRGAGKMDVDQFVKYGYVPYSDPPEGHLGQYFQFSASHTLEYSFSSYAVAQFAKELKKTSDYSQLMELSTGWEKLYDPSQNLIRPKYANGRFVGQFNPLEAWRGFQEGNALQYTFFVPHKPEKLIERMGDSLFCHRLDSIFSVAQKFTFGGGKVIDAFSGLESPYNHGNQPCLQESWMFNFSSKPYLTQKWTRAICNEFYGNSPEHGYGYGQDEDQGQLGAWYVMSSIGLFDVMGGVNNNPTYQIGSPVFDKVTINRNGKKIDIKVGNNSDKNIYVSSMTWNKEVYNQPIIDRETLYNGGVLELFMDSIPNKGFRIQELSE
ncbi:MAG: GH92 family glycosyl hydrolase [Phocaeicola sp.]